MPFCPPKTRPTNINKQGQRSQQKRSLECIAHNFVELFHWMLVVGPRCNAANEAEIQSRGGIPPPPRSIGILGLRGKCELIQRNLRVAGKIFRNKELAARRLPLFVATSRVPRSGCGCQGQMSQWLREIDRRTQEIDGRTKAKFRGFGKCRYPAGCYGWLSLSAELVSSAHWHHRISENPVLS